MSRLSNALRRFRPTTSLELPERVLPCRWSYLPLKPFLIIDCDPVAEAILGLASTTNLNRACAAFAERLSQHPVLFTHGVVDARHVVILGASPDPEAYYSGCAAAWLLMDRYLDPVDAAIFESMACDAAPV